MTARTVLEEGNVNLYCVVAIRRKVFHEHSLGARSHEISEATPSTWVPRNISLHHHMKDTVRGKTLPPGHKAGHATCSIA